MVCRLGTKSSLGFNRCLTPQGFFCPLLILCPLLQRESSCPDSLLVAAEDGTLGTLLPQGYIFFIPTVFLGHSLTPPKTSSLADAMDHVEKWKY